MAKTKKNKHSIETYNTGSVVIDIVMLILGLIFLINTFAGKGDQVASIFVRVIGGVLIAVGLIAAITFLIKTEKELFDWVIMIFGSAIGIFGIVVMARPEPIISILNWIMGMIALVYAIVIIFTALAILRPAGADNWGFSAIAGFVALVLAFLIIFCKPTNILLILIGATLIVGSVGGIANALLALQAKKAANKVIKAAGLDPAKETEDEAGEKNDNSDNGDEVTRF